MKRIVVASSVFIFFGWIMEASVGASPPAEDRGAETGPAPAPESAEVEEDAQAIGTPACTYYGAQWPNWCLTRCSGSPEVLRIVGTEAQIGGLGHCQHAANAYCHDIGQGHRRGRACWGHR